MAKSLASPYKIAMFVKSNSEKLYLQTNLAFHEEYFWEGALSERCQKLEVLNCDALDSSWFWGHEQKKITSIISAGGAISFGVVKKVQKNVKSVLSDAQQFYWMNNLCSQSERSCWYCLYSLGEGPPLLLSAKEGIFFSPVQSAHVSLQKHQVFQVCH